MTEEKQQTIAEFVAKHGLQLKARKTFHNPNFADGGDKMDHWEVQFVHPLNPNPRKLTTYFSMGVGHGGKAPKADEVLSCLLLDSSALNQDFEEWCSEFGYDEDSRKAEKTFHACQKIGKELKRFLGPEWLAELQQCEQL